MELHEHYMDRWMSYVCEGIKFHKEKTQQRMKQGQLKVIPSNNIRRREVHTISIVRSGALSNKGPLIIIFIIWIYPLGLGYRPSVLFAHVNHFSVDSCTEVKTVTRPQDRYLKRHHITVLRSTLRLVQNQLMELAGMTLDCLNHGHSYIMLTENK